MTTLKIPAYDQFIEDLLRVLAERPEGISSQDAREAVALRKGLTDEERLVMIPSGQQAAYQNRVGWAHDALKRARLSHSVKVGLWSLTPAGVEYAAQYPSLTPDQVRELARGYSERRATSSEDDDDLPPPGSGRSGALGVGSSGGQHVQQANLQALSIVRAILAAQPATDLRINGKLVTLELQQSTETRNWPNIPTLSEAENGPWPASLTWNAEWEGGGCSLSVDAVKTGPAKNAPKGVGIRVASNDRELVWVDLAAYLRRPARAGVYHIPAEFSLRKRVADRSDNPNTPMTEALAKLLQAHGLETTKSSIEALSIHKDTQTFTPDPEEVLRRLLILGLLKLDFFHSAPEQVAERGKPLIDLTELGFSTEEVEDAEGDEAPGPPTPDDVPKNLILFGPPGTGKTYEIQRSYEPLFRDGDDANCRFITFHQSYTYEDFIEGIRPNLGAEAHGSLRYELSEGVFLRCAQAALELAGFTDGMHAFCQLSTAERRDQFEAAPSYALFIDEINRGNVSRVFGELITLLEEDKRLGARNELIVELPYSHTLFGVPPNLHLIGTMNTADRSVEALDTALRRRFQFRESPPMPSLLNFEIEGVKVDALLTTINQRIEKLRDRDHALGHAYFLPLKDVDSTLDDLKAVFTTAILPLLQEYFFGDLGRIGLILGPRFVRRVEANQVRFANFDHEDSEALADRTLYAFAKIEALTASDFQSIYA